MYPAVDHYNRLTDLLQTTFIRLTKDENLWQGDLNGAMRNIVTTLADVLEVGRVAIWLLSDDHSALECQMLFTASAGTFHRGQRLSTTGLPDFFFALNNHRIIDACDAQNDTRVAELAHTYLRPNNIGAVLDATLHDAGILCGLISLEHLASPRLWSRDEQAFVVSVADLLSQLLVFHALKNSERRYRLLFDAAGDTIFTLRDGVIVDCNPHANELFLGERQQILRQGLEQLSPPMQPDGQHSAEKVSRLLMAAADEGSQLFDWTFRRNDGSLFECEVSLSSLRLSGVPYILAIVRDVTERREAEQKQRTIAVQLERHNKVLQMVNSLASQLHRTTNSLIIAEETLRVLKALQAAPLATFHLARPATGDYELVASLGYSPEQVEARRSLPINNSISIHALAQKQILRCNDIATDPRIDPRIRSQLMADGIKSMIVLPLLFHDDPLGVVGLHFLDQLDEVNAFELDTLRAVTQTVSLALVNANNVLELEYQAQHDSLTGLPNRTRLHREATDALRRIAGSSKGLSLMLLDLDRFKEVNDTLGHRTGDLLLKLVADRLQTSLRGQNAMIARLGGDEFAILLRAIDTPAEASELAASLVSTLRRPIEVEGIHIELGGSIGVAIYPQHGGTSHALLRCADVAMYAAKSQAAGVSFYDNAHDAHNPRRLALITELGQAIRGNQLVVYFQPKYDLQAGAWSGCEALVRWQHPTLGFIPPGEFVHFAETSDLIRPLTLWVARNALKSLREWRVQGLNVAVSVNLSTRNLLDATLPEALADLLMEFELPPDALELEITESALMTDPDRAMQVVNRIAALGMRLSIDDFGTGYSSLAYLKRLPLQSLKIDRSFVKEMLSDEQDAIIVRSTVGLAHSLGLEVIAEGVEDASTLQQLRDFGCDQAQGYVLGRPMPADQAYTLMCSPALAASGGIH